MPQEMVSVILSGGSVTDGSGMHEAVPTARLRDGDGARARCVGDVAAAIEGLVRDVVQRAGGEP